MNTKDTILLLMTVVLLTGTIAFMMNAMEKYSLGKEGVLLVARAPEDGGFAPLDIYVEQDKPAKIFIKNEGMETHGFAIPALGVKSIQVKSGKIGVVEFTPKEIGIFHGHCSVYCSDYHPLMQVRVHVVSQEEMPVFAQQTIHGNALNTVREAHNPEDLLREFPHDVIMDPTNLPPPLQRNNSELVEIHLETVEVIDEVADGAPYFFWTYNGKIPGPFLRVREGDTVELTLTNSITSKYPHSIDLHAVTGQGGGAAMTQVKPGESKKIRFIATNRGLYVYHCATSSVPEHMTHGMYGLILVEPPEGLPLVDREYYFMQGELYTAENIGSKGFKHFSKQKMLDEDADYMTFNGKPTAITGARSPRFKTGETVRLFVGNGGVSYTSSFHVIGEIFDKVYPEASLSEVHKDVQTTIVPAGGATITEFITQMPASYILVDHALSRLERGLVAIIIAEGESKNATLEQVALSIEEQDELSTIHIEEEELEESVKITNSDLH